MRPPDESGELRASNDSGRHISPDTGKYPNDITFSNGFRFQLDTSVSFND